MEAALILRFLSHQGERNIKSEPQPQMPTIAQASVGMTWQLESSVGNASFMKPATAAVSHHLSQ